MTRTEYLRLAKRQQRERYGHEGITDYWLHGGRDKKRAYWSANKEQINRRRREARRLAKLSTKKEPQ